MEMKIVVEGPLHTRPRWTAGQPCYDYQRSPRVSWEAKVSIGLEKYDAAKQSKAQGGGLMALLIQQVTKTNKLDGKVNQCDPSTTELIDVWQIPLSNGGTQWRHDAILNGFPRADVCVKDVTGCILTSTWKATVRAVLMDLSGGTPDMPTRRNPVMPDERDDPVMDLLQAMDFFPDAGSKKGTVALIKDGKSPFLWVSTREDREIVVGTGTVQGGTVERMTPDDFRKIYEPLIKVVMARGEYEMKPVVPHCLGATDQTYQENVEHGDPVEGIPTSTTEDPRLRSKLPLSTRRDDGKPGIPSSDGVTVNGSEPSPPPKGSSGSSVQKSIGFVPAGGGIRVPPSHETLRRAWGARLRPPTINRPIED